MAALKRLFHSIVNPNLALALALGVPAAVSAAGIGKTFATPEAAASALVTAASTDDTNALRAIFGPTVDDIVNPDRVQATNEHRAFLSAYQQTNRIVHESDSKCVLEVGTNSWPFPVPIVKREGQWYFDTEGGNAFYPGSFPAYWTGNGGYNMRNGLLIPFPA